MTPVRREMFRLAHAHGTLLNLVLLAAAICARLDLIRLGPHDIARAMLRRRLVTRRFPLRRSVAFQG